MTDEDDYRGWAERVMGELCAMGRPFTADHIHSMIPSSIKPSHPNVLSALFSRAQKVGRIRNVGMVRSHRPERHGGLIKLWVSADSWVRTREEVLIAENEALKTEREVLSEALGNVQEILRKYNGISDPPGYMLLGELMDVVPDVTEEQNNG